jgi:hypothetical protein
VTLFRGHEVAIEELMKQADFAMYRAKGAGRNAIRFFDPAMEAAVTDHAALENDLRQAIVQKQFVLHYPAQVAVNVSALQLRQVNFVEQVLWMPKADWRQPPSAENGIDRKPADFQCGQRDGEDVIAESQRGRVFAG